MRHPYFAAPRPTVFGHRGASGERPENTVPAFELALAQGADALETDVHRTRDGVIVVCHDADLARTTDGEGPIAEHTLAEVRALDAGHRFTPDQGRTHPFRGNGITIPTLEELFNAFPEARINVEVKACDEALIRDAVGLIREARRAYRTLLAAGEDDTMAAIRRALGGPGEQPATGACLGDILGFIRAATSGGPPPEEPMALQIPSTFGGRPLVTEALDSFAHAHHVAVHVWTINDEDEMRALLGLAVDGVMSDFPGRLRAVVDDFVGG
jgi:glycerophosphoryl diester phosphodiesterase